MGIMVAIGVVEFVVLVCKELSRVVTVWARVVFPEMSVSSRWLSKRKNER